MRHSMLARLSPAERAVPLSGKDFMAARVIKGLTELQSLVGRTLGTSDWFDVTQERVNEFAEATGDRQWIHCEPLRAAAESPYGGTIAHGFFTLSLCIKLAESSFVVE